MCKYSISAYIVKNKSMKTNGIKICMLASLWLSMTLVSSKVAAQNLSKSDFTIMEGADISEVNTVYQQDNGNSNLFHSSFTCNNVAESMSSYTIEKLPPSIIGNNGFPKSKAKKNSVIWQIRNPIGMVVYTNSNDTSLPPNTQWQSVAAGGTAPSASGNVTILNTPTPADIPTIGQWGLIILGILMCIFGVVCVQHNHSMFLQSHKS